MWHTSKKRWICSCISLRIQRIEHTYFIRNKLKSMIANYGFWSYPGLSGRYPRGYLGGIPAWFLVFSNANNAQKGKAGNCFRYFCILGGIWSIEMNFLDKWFQFSSILICIQPCEHLFTVFCHICDQKLLLASGTFIWPRSPYSWLMIHHQM